MNLSCLDAHVFKLGSDVSVVMSIQTWKANPVHVQCCSVCNVILSQRVLSHLTTARIMPRSCHLCLQHSYRHPTR